MLYLAILNTIIDSITNITYKQALSCNPHPIVHISVGCAIKLFVIIAFVILFPFLSEINLTLCLFVFFGCIFSYIASNISQYCYRHEKISAIAPYSKADSVLIIIYSFFVFGDVSIISFCVALATILFIVSMNINLKSFAFSKITGLYLVVKVLRAISTILIGYVIFEVNPEVVYVLKNSCNIFITIFAIYYFKIKLSDYILPKKYYKLKAFNEIFGVFTSLASLFLIKNLGLVVSTMLGFLGFVGVMFFAYIMDGDKPTKKNLITGIVVMTLVSIGYYFK